MDIDLLFTGRVTKVVRLLWRPVLLSYDHNYGSSEHYQITTADVEKSAEVQVDIWYQVIELPLILKAQGSTILLPYPMNVWAQGPQMNVQNYHNVWAQGSCMGPGFQTFHKCMGPVFQNYRCMG